MLGLGATERFSGGKLSPGSPVFHQKTADLTAFPCIPRKQPSLHCRVEITTYEGFMSVFKGLLALVAWLGMLWTGANSAPQHAVSGAARKEDAAPVQDTTTKTDAEHRKSRAEYEYEMERLDELTRDSATSDRLVCGVGRRHPERSLRWQAEKAQWDLIRDRM
jgi:hypothetical protein